MSITNSGFSGTPQEMASVAVGATEGFSFVLAGAKALLEHGLQLNLVPDRFPDGLPTLSATYAPMDCATMALVSASLYWCTPRCSSVRVDSSERYLEPRRTAKTDN